MKPNLKLSIRDALKPQTVNPIVVDKYNIDQLATPVFDASGTRVAPIIGETLFMVGILSDNREMVDCRFTMGSLIDGYSELFEVDSVRNGVPMLVPIG